MRILITGATGLVGSALVQLCHQQGIAVNYLTTSKKKITKELDYQGFYWNPTTGEIDEDAFKEVSVIVHLAGSTIAQRWTDTNKQRIKDSRIKSAGLIYDVLARFRESGNGPTIKHIVSSSAIGCYPSSPTKYYDEKYPEYAEGFLGEVVQEWESAIIEFQKLDIQTALVRTGIILDEKSGALPKIMKPIKMYAGAPLGSGEQWQSWIHIEDMARLYLHIITNELTGIYNGVAPNPVTNQKLTKVAAQILKKPLVVPKVPAFVLKAMLGDMAAIVLQSQKVCADKIQKTGFIFEHPTLEGALEDLLQ
jgi:uncharacterized protein (TIGR01777 family)